MKKFLIIICVIVLICSVTYAVSIEIETPRLKYLINNNYVEMPEGEQGFLYNSRTYVPIRFIAEALNKDVQWDGDTNTIIITDKQPDNYTLENNVLYKNGTPYKIKADGEISYKKLYNNKLIYYVSKNINDEKIYEVYLCDFATMLTEKIDITADIVGDYKVPLPNHIFTYISVDKNNTLKGEYPMGVINLNTGAVNYVSHGHQACMIWENDTIYYSHINNDGIYKETVGGSVELIENIGTSGAWLVKNDNKLICYNTKNDTGAVIDLISKSTVSNTLRQAEKNTVLLSYMMHLVYGYDNGYEYEPMLTETSKKTMKNLKYVALQGNDMIFESIVPINHNQYPQKIYIQNGCGTLELVLSFKENNQLKLNLDFVLLKDKELIMNTILK